MRCLGSLVRQILLTSLILAEEIKNNVKRRRLWRVVRLILLTREEIKNKCKNEVTWASGLSHSAYKLNISRGN